MAVQLSSHPRFVCLVSWFKGCGEEYAVDGEAGEFAVGKEGWADCFGGAVYVVAGATGAGAVGEWDANKAPHLRVCAARGGEVFVFEPEDVGYFGLTVVEESCCE